jgi:hypothetical protein
MGKRFNSKGLRLVRTKDWTSVFYSDLFNYSNILTYDLIIRDYVLNFLSKYKIYVLDIKIKRLESKIIIDLLSYNDFYTHKKAFLNCYNSLSRYKCLKPRKSTALLNLRKETSKYWLSILNFWSKDSKEFNFPEKIISKKKKTNLFDLYDRRSIKGKIRYSLRRLLVLNLSYLTQTIVIINNKNAFIRDPSLFNILWKINNKIRSPFPKHVSLKLIYLIYHALKYKNSLLLCRYLKYLLPTLCKKKRKDRKIIPFYHFFKKIVSTLINNGIINKKDIRGIKVVFKGRFNGARRKSKLIAEHGQTSLQSIDNNVSYKQEDCFTIFGTTSIKVWIFS